jgi:hypothetical protein
MIQRTKFKLRNSAVAGNAVAAAIAVFTNAALIAPAAAQVASPVPANCQIDAANTTLTCTTTVKLSGVIGEATSNPPGINIRSSGSPPPPAPPPGPVCSGGLTATPQSGLTPNTATAISLAACLQSTDRATFDYRWVAPAVAGTTAGSGSATATLAAGGSVVYQVNVCASTATTALCTLVSTSPITATAATPPPPPPPSGQACAPGSGNPRVTVNFTTPAQNFTYQSIVGQSTHVTQITVAPDDNTANKRYLATWGIVQDDTTTFSNRTVSLSQTCNDFSPSKILFTNTQGGNISIVTANDPRPSTIEKLTPGVWYINVRNDDCPAGVNCSITGIYTNRNR